MSNAVQEAIHEVEKSITRYESAVANLKAELCSKCRENYEWNRWRQTPSDGCCETCSLIYTFLLRKEIK